MHPDLTLNGFNQDSRRLRSGRPHHRIEIPERHRIEAFNLRSEAFEIFGASPRRNGGKGAAMKGPFEGDQPVTFRRA